MTGGRQAGMGWAPWRTVVVVRVWEFGVRDGGRQGFSGVVAVGGRAAAQCSTF